MKLFNFILVSLGSLVCLFVVLNLVTFQTHAATQNVDLSIDVQEYMAFSLSGGSAIDFGSFNPGTPICSSTATVASVTTNALNGYTLGVSDGSDTDSALTKDTDHIADYAGTIGTPTTWTGTGLGVGLWAADTNKEAKWGTGSSVCHANNKYAGVPSAAATGHTVTGYHSGANTSSWSWKVDAPNNQATGAYTGSVTFTATGVLS